MMLSHDTVSVHLKQKLMNMFEELVWASLFNPYEGAS